MAKRKYYYYILVMTEEGPTFVTKENIFEKMCWWNKAEKPLQYPNMETAAYMAACLTINGNNAFAVCALYELEYQPYRYELGHFEWKDKEEGANNE